MARGVSPRARLILRVFGPVGMAAALTAAQLVPSLVPAQATSAAPGNNVLAHALSVELGRASQPAHRALVSSGAVYPVLQSTGVLDARAAAASKAAVSRPNVASNTKMAASGISVDETQGCPLMLGSNVRVNQDCSLRRQAEEVIEANPTNPRNLIAGQNDSRLGFNKCGYDWSFDGGRTWGDQVPPFYQQILKDGHTADACSDPTVTFDSIGNAYAGGILFDINSAASAFVVVKSNSGIGGAFYHTPQPGAFQVFSDSPLGVIASDNDPNIFNDKEFIVADQTASSPKANNVYATWTRFNGATGAGVGGNSPIYFSQSSDGGATWSPGIEISGANAAFCTTFSGETNANACDQDQGSQPIVGRDGTLYVAFTNGNTPTSGINQHMLVSCPATADCGNPASWTAPNKISDDFGTQPVGPNAATGCPAGRQCLPPNGYRMDDFVEGSISVDNAGTLYAVWADFRNGGGTCPPNSSAATATPPCNNDVFYAVSTDHGATWSSARLVTGGSRFGQTAQWMPWSKVSPDGRTLWIAFYDRSYGACEQVGCNDITLASVTDAATSHPHYGYKRLTSSSMPNLTPANNPVQAGFLGDYMWVTTNAAGKPYVVWADTRGRFGTAEEDIYMALP